MEEFSWSSFKRCLTRFRLCMCIQGQGTEEWVPKTFNLFCTFPQNKLKGMLRVLPPMKQTCLATIRLLQVAKTVVKETRE